MRIGEIEIHPLIDGAARMPPTAAFTATSDQDWAPHKTLLGDDGMLEFAMGGFLFRLGDRLVVVDAGVGPNPPAFFTGGQFLDSLASAGASPADVTDVVFTHLHFDHIGWASHEGAAVFPNATYRADARDWEYFVEPPASLMPKEPFPEGSLEGLVAPGSAKPFLDPVVKQVETWDGNGTILPGLDIRTAAGHTPGSAILVLSSGTARGLLIGDVAHCPVELLDDEWAGIGDVDPALAKTTRQALARELEGTDIPVAASHFPGLRFGRVLTGEGRRYWSA